MIGQDAEEEKERQRVREEKEKQRLAEEAAKRREREELKRAKREARRAERHAKGVFSLRTFNAACHRVPSYIQFKFNHRAQVWLQIFPY